MKSKKNNGQRAPRFALMRNVNEVESFYIEASGTGTGRKEARWDPDINHATHWPSKYAAKCAGRVFDLEGVLPREVK